MKILSPPSIIPERGETTSDPKNKENLSLDLHQQVHPPT